MNFTDFNIRLRKSIYGIRNFGKAGVKVSPLALGLGLRGQGDSDAPKGLLNMPSILVSI